MCRSRLPRRSASAAAAAAVVASLAAPSLAADVVSQWGGGMGDWTNPSRWNNTPSVNFYPDNGNGGFTYDARVQSGSVTLEQNVVVEALRLSGNNATIDGSGSIGTTMFEWNGGTLAGGGAKLTVTGNSIIPGNADRTLSRTIDNAGTATWTGSGGIAGAGTYNNLEGALFDCQNDGLGGLSLGIANLNNAGTFRKSAGSETRLGGASHFDNTGTVEVDSGFALRFNGTVEQVSFDGTVSGGTWKTAGLLVLPHPITSVGAGANVVLDGLGSQIQGIAGLSSVAGAFTITNGRNFNAGGALNNSGTVHVGPGSTLDLSFGGTHTGTFNVAPANATFSSGNLYFSGGTHVFGPGSQFGGTGQIMFQGGTITANGNPTSTGSMHWFGGTIDGSGSIGTASTPTQFGSLFISGSGGKTLNGTINNGANTIWSGTSGVFGTGTFNNLLAAIFQVQTPSDSGAWGTNFNNLGAIIKNSPGASNFGGVSHLNSPGAVFVTQGTLNVNGTLAQHVGSVLNGGQWTVTGNATLNLNSGPDITSLLGSASVHLYGPNASFPRVNALEENASSLVLYDGHVFTTAGDFRNTGFLLMAQGAIFRLSGVMYDDGQIAIESGGKLDLTDQKLITTDPIGTWDPNASAYTYVTGLVQSGRNEGTWNGTGIITSKPEALTDYTTLGVATAAEVLGIGPTETGTWGGRTVLGSDTLVAYTYGGDANLDGMINIDDYGQIDFNVGLSGLVFGYFNGDFNLDGLINIDDYGIIDFNVGIQGPPIPMGKEVASVAAVPEPALVSLLVLPVAGLIVPRRRRPQWSR